MLLIFYLKKFRKYINLRLIYKTNRNMDYSPLLKFKNSCLFVFEGNQKLTKIEKYIIQRVKEIRKEKGYTQEDLSLALEKNVGFIGDIEAPSKKAKYNILHLNEIAKVLFCSPKDFWPDEPM